MAVTVSHGFNCAIADDATDAAAGKILPSHWNATHTVANALDKTGDTMTGTLTSTLGTITANSPAFSASQTWNNGAVAFTAALISVTDTASDAASFLFDLKVGGTSKFSVTPGGIVKNVFGFFATDNVGIGSYGSWQFFVNVNRTSLQYLGMFSWSSTSDAYTGSLDTGLARNAAGVVEVNNGTAGTYRDLKARNTITPGVAVASLTGAAQGARSFVTDSTVVAAGNFGAAVVGGGANAVPVYYDGATWRIG